MELLPQPCPVLVNRRTDTHPPATSSWVSEADTQRMCLGLCRGEALGAAVHSPACPQQRPAELGQGAREDEEEEEKAEMRGLQEAGTNPPPRYCSSQRPHTLLNNEVIRPARRQQDHCPGMVTDISQIPPSMYRTTKEEKKNPNFLQDKSCSKPMKDSK